MPEAVVGRERELKAAAAFLSRMAGGRSGLLLEGDAGVGKTTLWLDAIRQAEARGYCVLRARPVEAELKLSYAALADLVGGVFDDLAASLPPPQERALAAVLARIPESDEDEWYGQRGEEIWRADRRSHLAVAELRAGNVATAQGLVEEACEALEHVEVGGPFAMVFEKRALVDAFCGRADRARDTLMYLIDGFERRAEPWWTVLSLSTLAVAEFAAGELPAADDALTRMHELATSLGVADVLTDRSEPFHVELLVELGEIDRARDVLQRLEERGRRLPRLWIETALPSTRALVAAADGDVAGALALADQLDTAQALRLPFALGCHLLVKGRVLRRARQKRAAADALDEARAIFERLGTPAWSARARVESERIGFRRAAPRGLTESERRVAQLVATGLTNRQVAERLFISPKTVEANLGRAYVKLGIRSRAELGARLDDLARPIAET